MYKIKKEFTPMDFYDYVKSCGREKCEEFRKDFSKFLNMNTNTWLVYKPGDEEQYNRILMPMLKDRANFRKYMIEGGFIEEERKKVKCTMHEDTDYYKINIKGQKGIDWSIARIYKNDGRVELYSYINDPSISTDADGYIEVIKG